MEQVNLQYIPNGVEPVVHVSQNDVGRQFQLRLYDGATAYSIPSGTTAKVEGIKPDGKAFSYSDAVSVSGNIVTVTTKKQMTIVSGMVTCEIRFVKNSATIGTLNFKMLVEPSPVNEDADISETVLPEIFALATEQLENAEAWANGTKNGVAVGSSEPQYHNNAKFYSEQASSSASTAVTNATTATNKAAEATTKANVSTEQALKSEGFAVGRQNDSEVDSSSPYYHNNAEYYKNIARNEANRAEEYSVNVPYIGENGNWWVWNTSQGSYVDSGVDASITVSIADITMLEPDAAPRVTNSGTPSDPVFHLFIPRGKGISSIEKTSTSGLVDTYTITFSDGATTTFNITNGKTAYQSAVEGGYTKSEVQFETDLSHFGDWADDAREAADDAADSQQLAHQSALDAAQSASLAEQYAGYVTPHFIIVNNRLYLKDDAEGEFIVVNNRLYLKLAS
ncbi:MAG: hypothetical protein J6H31_02710 [Butyrivibrio sp.]|nr:hypothetical protein [Butyrivibrio sp.]